MKLGQRMSFCTCLRTNNTEHVTEVDDNGLCLWCDHFAIQRKVDEKDINRHERWIKLLEKKHSSILKVKTERLGEYLRNSEERE